MSVSLVIAGDVWWFALGWLAGHLFFTAIRKWRKAAERRVWTKGYLNYPEWTWPFFAVEFCITHPVRAWRAKWDK